MHVTPTKNAKNHSRRQGWWDNGQQVARFRADEPTALKLLSVGESPRNEQLPPAELAAWSIVASVILNLDETVTKG